MRRFVLPVLAACVLAGSQGPFKGIEVIDGKHYIVFVDQKGQTQKLPGSPYLTGRSGEWVLVDADCRPWRIPPPPPSRDLKS